MPIYFSDNEFKKKKNCENKLLLSVANLFKTSKTRQITKVSIWVL